MYNRGGMNNKCNNPKVLMNNKANKIRGQTNNIVASTVCTVGYSSIPHAIAHRSPGYGCKSSGWETVTEPRMTKP